MKKYKKVIYLAVLFCLMLLNKTIYSQPLASGYSKYLGSAAESPLPSSFDSYWNQVTPGNAGKWGSVETTRNHYNWGSLDIIYNYAILRGFRYKHHTLIWGQQQPNWISSLDTASQFDEIEEWIRLVGERYPLIDYVDVVNEPLPGHNQPSYKAALGGNGVTGWDWVINSFKLARQYMPNAKLLLNDFGIINDNNATTQYLTIINLLKDSSLIDGIGVQGHRFELMYADTTTMKYNLNRLEATGLPVHISEFDVGTVNGSPYDSVFQLSEYQRVFPVLWNHPGVAGITLWGYIEGLVWQVNTYIVRANGSETPAMRWLRSYLVNGNYRTYQTGNWNDVSTWEQYVDTSWVYPAGSPPALSDGAIAIRSGDTVTVTASDSVDQVTVMSGGELAINNGVSLYIKDGSGTDLLVGGTISNEGSIVKDTTATIEYISGSKYSHRQDGGVVPIAVWETGSTCEITEMVNNAPTNMDQDFYNFSWNCASQNADVSLGWQSGKIINGTLTVTNTNWDHVSENDPSHRLQLFDGQGSCTINNVVINGYTAALTAQGGDYADTVIVNGNITLSSGGMLSLSNSSGGVTEWYAGGDFAVSDSAYIGKSNSGNVSKIIFNKAGVQNFTLPSSGVTLFGAPNIVVDSGATLNMGTSVFGGDGSFQLQRRATLQTGHPNGIDSSITCSGANGGGNHFSKAAGYTFNGSVAQETGNLLPDTVGNLTIDNSSGVTLQNSVVANDTMEMKSGALSLGGNVLFYGVNGTLKYSLSLTQPTADAEFPLTGGPVHLAIANTAGTAATLHANRSIPGNLGLISGELAIGANTLIAGSATAVLAPTTFVNTDGGGKLRLPVANSTEVLYPIGASGGSTASSCPVWITNNGDSDTITLGAVMDTTYQTTKPRVKLKWNIAENVEGGGDYDLKFGWSTNGLLHENFLFMANRLNNARIFLMGSDTVEAGSGDYEFNSMAGIYSAKRGGISELGTFAVGKFKDSVWMGVEEELPRSYRLLQNYPNPFNSVTVIRYELPKSEKVDLVIYNLLGRQIAVLERGKKDAGYYKVEWKASNFPTGVYFYRLTAGSFTDTKKLLLVK
jgi:GH35 family endo-1,4-beta-xylanase